MSISGASPLSDFIAAKNSNKFFFTPGPAPLIVENILGLDGAFGRGDSTYDAAEEFVLARLRQMTGKPEIVRLQGSASQALELMIANFAYGRIVVVRTGYYSDRLLTMCAQAKKMFGNIQEVVSVAADEIAGYEGVADWVLSCPVETSMAYKIPIPSLRSLADKSGARLMLDATASIGLEDYHQLADAMAFSSCKGLFALTGASFVAFEDPPTCEIESFSLSLGSHTNKMMTGPYHAVLSLTRTLEVHDDLVFSVEENKNRALRDFASFLVLPDSNQPKIATALNALVTARDSRVILYQPRGTSNSSIICHLGEAHLGKAARGDILELINVQPKSL